MNGQLHRLTYYSRNEIAAEGEAFAAEIETILAASRRNNILASVTGALMFSNGSFGQVLEGTRQAVESTFERIQCDPRHSDVSLLSFEPIAARGFANWSMGFIGAENAASARFINLARSSGFDHSRLDTDELFSTLHRLMLEEESL